MEPHAETENRILKRAIIHQIRQRGRITFREFMNLCLYHHLYGYYCSSEEKIGKRKDYYTRISFLISGGIASCVDAYASPVPFLNTLVTEFSERNAETAERSLKQFEAHAEEAGLFVKSVGRVWSSRPGKDKLKRGVVLMEKSRGDICH
jgi:hypothetical protein